MYCRSHELAIRTEYALWKLPPANAIQYIVNIRSWHIHHIVVYKNCYWVLHDFLLGGVGRLAYVRRDPPVHVVRFVRYVALIGDYYALLRSRSALCLYGFCRMAFSVIRHIGKRRKATLCQFVSFCICRLWKNSNYTAPCTSDILISYSRAE